MSRILKLINLVAEAERDRQSLRLDLVGYVLELALRAMRRKRGRRLGPRQPHSKHPIGTDHDQPMLDRISHLLTYVRAGQPRLERALLAFHFQAYLRKNGLLRIQGPARRTPTREAPPLVSCPQQYHHPRP